MAKELFSFQNREQNSGDDGDDFERFVLECFKVAKEEIGFVRSLRRGRDGAIDLIDQYSEPGATTVAECKYIGTGGFDDAKARWKEVYRRFEDYLPQLSADPGKNRTSPYRTWIDSARPVQRYRFCITVSLTANEVIRLEKLIAKDFAKLADSGVEAIRYLGEVEGAVRVLSWDWFFAELTTNPSLAFRWFYGLPAGMRLFDRSGRTGQSFRDFLSGRQLAYFSRDSFAAQHGGTIARGEAALAADLISGRTNAIVLAGPGGVGKTRLAHELAIKLSDETVGFEAFWLDRSASAQSIEELAKHYPTKASIVFIVDYAEAAHRLGEIADAALHLIEQSGHQIRIIATCRASAMNKVRDDFEVLTPEIKSLAARQGGESGYLDWVTRSILTLEPFLALQRLETVCHGVPALAAFAVFLFRNDRAQFNAQFGALLASDDFQSWSNKRIAALASQKSFSERALAEIAMVLPIPPERQAAFRQAHGDLIARLLTDRWIEVVDGYIVAAHDVLADAMLARWLFEAETAATVRTIDLLQDAATAQDLPHALTVLARLTAHPTFLEIEGREVLHALLASHSGQVVASVGELLESPLLQLQDKLDLIVAEPSMGQAIANNLSLHIDLARIAEQAAFARKDGIELDVPPIFSELLEFACSQSHDSNFVLRRALAFDPARFRQPALANIAHYPVSEQTHFLIVQMLRSGEPTEAMREAVYRWLTLNSCSPRASFVYQAWLYANGDKDEIDEQLQAWVDAHGLTPEASHVFKAWLHSGGDKNVVGEQLQAWVDAHGVLPEASYVYNAWLNAGGDKDAIGEQLLAWVDAHSVLPEASYVYNAWLDAGGDKDAIGEQLLAWVNGHGLTREASHVFRAWLHSGGDKDAIGEQLQAWVEAHGVLPEASYVYHAWLDAGGDKDAIGEQLLAWVDAHGLTAAAGFVYQAWLNAGGDKDAIGEQLQAWVDAHGLTPAAGFVYQSWLDAGGDKVAVDEQLLAWVGILGRTFEADHVYRSWLDAGGDFEIIEEQVFDWALAWSHTEDFVFLSKALSMRPNLPEPVTLAVARWAATYAEHEDSIARMRRLLSHLQHTGMSIGGFIALMDYLLQLVESLGPRSDVDRSQMWAICISLSYSKLYNLDPFGVQRFVAQVISSGIVFDTKLTEGPWHYLAGSQSTICHLAISALREGMLDPARDSEGLARLAGWIEATTSDRAEATRLLELVRGKSE